MKEKKEKILEEDIEGFLKEKSGTYAQRRIRTKNRLPAHLGYR